MNISEFQQKVSEAGKPVIIDFWASWCVPCRVTKPILESLAKEYAAKVEFLAVNADESRELLERYRVNGIPTVLSFRAGNMISRVTGAQNETNYRKLFDAVVQGKDTKLPPTPFERMLRLGAGGLLVLVGISTGYWYIVAVGAIVAFLGVYDRCPIWSAVTGLLKRKES
jgi:thioredoxin 1